MDEVDQPVEEPSPEAVLEAMRREGVAYVAQHYDPDNPNDEEVWDAALRQILGPDEWWAAHSRNPNPTQWTEEVAERWARVVLAWIAIMKVGLVADRELEQQERLSGAVTEPPAPYTPEWTALYATGFGDGIPARRLDLIVGNYLTNVRDGLMDATGAFCDLVDDEEEGM